MKRFILIITLICFITMIGLLTNSKANHTFGSATVTIMVCDVNDDPIENATVLLFRPGTSLTFEDLTDSSGKVMFQGVYYGSYRIIISNDDLTRQGTAFISNPNEWFSVVLSGEFGDIVLPAE